jgi:hypothetical protein
MCEGTRPRLIAPHFSADRTLPPAAECLGLPERTS